MSSARWSDLPPDAVRLISSKLSTAQNAVSLALANRAARTATQANLHRRKARREAHAVQVAAMMRDIITAIPHLIGRAKRVAPPAERVPRTALTLAGHHHFEGNYTIARRRYFVSMRWDAGKYKIIVKNRGRLLIDVQLNGRKRLPKAVLAVGTVDNPQDPEEMAVLKAGLRMAGVRFRTVNYIPVYGGWHADAPPPIPHLMFP